MSADFIVRHGTREEAIRRHREIAARSYFPYHGRRPDGTGVDASPSSLTVRPVKQKGNAHHHNGNHDALEWPSRTIPSIHQHLAKADEEREQEQGTLVFVPPVSPTRDRHHLAHLRLWEEFRTTFVKPPNVEEGRICSPKLEVDRMPSTIERSQSPNSTARSVTKKVNVAPKDDEERLLYGLRRSDDAAAVPIARPTTRPMNRPQGKVPSGGPKPRNTLHTDPIYQRSHLHETTRSRSRGGETPQLVLQASRGANVAPSLRTADSREAWAVSSPKRQKIVHQANSPSSGNSTDELLDQQNPENVTFGPSRRSSQAVSIPSFNSQASNLQTRSNGPITRLPEYHSVERTMNSSGPTRKQKRREASQNGLRSNGLPVSPEPPSLSQSTELIELDGGKNIDDSELDRAPEGSYLDVVRKLSSSIDAPKAKLSKAIPVPADKKTSPFFPQPTLPPRPSNGTQGHHSNIQRSQNSKQKHSDKLDEQFRSTNGSRRSLDYNMSSDADELQMGTTVGKYTDINRSRNFSPSKGSSSTLKATSPTQDTGLEPSNIKSSDFASVKPKAQSDSRFSGPSIREKSTPWFADVAAVSIGGEKVTWNAMALVFVERDSNYVLKMDGKTTDIQILPQKLVKILWEASGRKIRLMSSKQGVEDGIVDLEFCKEKDVSRLITKLKTQPGCTTTSVPSERMDKMFEKRRSEAKKSIAPGQAHPYNQVDLHQSETERPPGDVHERVPWNEKAVGNERRTRSLVGELVARANLENPRVTGQAEIKYVQNGPPQEESVSRILERLKPDHNEHLRRSKRTSSEFKKPRNSLFDDIDDLPAVERYSKIHGLGDPWKKPLIYPKLGKKKTTVEFSDLERLDEGEFLNDNLLSFYLRFLENTLEEQRPHLAKRVYFFNTFFFATLMNTHKGRKGFNYQGVQKWTRNVDLFTFDYIVVPINEATHWYLAIICNLPALDRNLSLSGIDSGSCIDTAPTETFRNSTEPSPRSSSPTRDELEQEPVKLVDDEKEPDERGARTSFAEMSLDGEEKSPATGDTARLKNAGAAASTDEDKEMLDGHSQDASSLARPGVATDHHLRRDIEDPIDVLDDGRNKTGKSKKGKRKSGPPAVTKTPPDKPVIITFDSLGLARSSTIRILKDYLREEAKAKRGGMEFEPGQIKGITASQIPQQDNFYDCGVFLLGYVAKFLQDDPKDFIAKIIRREYDETKDWPDLNPSLLRSSIRGQVLKLHQDQVLERQKERDAQKSESDRGGLHEDQKQRSSPIPPIDQAKTVSRKPQLTTDEAVENPAKAPLSSQPATRKDALKTAMSIDPQMPTEGSMPSIPNKRIGRVTEVLVQEADQAKESQPAKVPSPKPGMNRPEKQKEGIPDSLDNEPSLVLVESQSQQDGSAPKSFYKSYPKPTTPTLVQRSPELPAEIQDSQPSQTSRTFANVIRRDSEEADSAPPAMQKRVLQEGPMVLIEEPRTARKRKTSDDGAGGATERHSKRTNEADLSKRETQDSAPVKRKRLGRKVQRSGEVINIDD